ncbi:MAG: sigma-70 family RNA polymerase sigma factor [Candidatus Omnitrophota bacterium]
MLKKTDDKELVERCIHGDPAAWADLTRKYSTLISISIRNRLKRHSLPFSQGDVDDIRQEVLMSVWTRNKLLSVRNKEKIAFWLSIVAGNTAVDYMRSKLGVGSKRMFDCTEMMGSGEIDARVLGIPSREDDPAVAASNKELVDIVKNALDDLSDNERLVMKLHLFFEKDYADIAKILSLPGGTVSSCIKRSKEKLASALRKKL